MIKADLWQEIHSRFKLKETKKAIARAVGLSVQTVRKFLRQEEPKAYVREKQESEILGPYRGYILQRLAAVGYCAQAIFEELQVRGYRGSYQTIKRFVSPLRKEAEVEATIRFETPPGPGRLGPVLDDDRGQEGEGSSLRSDARLQPADVRRGHGEREAAGLPPVP